MSADHDNWPTNRRDATAQAIPAAVRLTTDSQFDEPLARLRALLSQSIDDRRDAEALFKIQSELATMLIWAQDSQKRFKSELSMSEVAETDHFSSPGTIINVCKRLQHLVRQIGDGIAWRALGHDRTMLRELARKPHTGHMQPLSAEQEVISGATHVVRTGELVVINDLTNFLRYGDLTAVGDDGITIFEVKGGAGSAKSGHSSRQKKKAGEVIDFISTGSKLTSDGMHRLVDLHTKPVPHWEKLREILATANKTGVGFVRISDCQFAVAFDTHHMGERIAAGLDVADVVRSPFAQQGDTEAFDSLSLSRQFTWNVAPYSIFSLPPEDRFSIMAGQIMLINFFSFGNLWRCLRRRGLLVRPPLEGDLSELEGLQPREVAALELKYAMTVARKDRPPVLSVPMSEFARLFYEFLDEESFADRIEEELEIAPDAAAQSDNSAVFLHTGFRAEADLWD